MQEEKKERMAYEEMAKIGAEIATMLSQEDNGTYAITVMQIAADLLWSGDVRLIRG